MQRIKCQPNESIFFSDSLARDFVEQLYGQFQPLLRALEEISTETQFCLRWETKQDIKFYIKKCSIEAISSEIFKFVPWPLSSTVSYIVSRQSGTPFNLRCHLLSSVFRIADKMADNKTGYDIITINSDDDDLEVTHYATPTPSSMTPPRRV